MNNNFANEKGSRVLDVFYPEDLGAPFKVSLHNSVTAVFDEETGEMVKYHIPEFDALVDAVIMARLAHEQKLSGAEVKFLRKAAGLTQAALARAIGIDVATLSRVEKGKQPLGPASEKVARGCLFKAAGKRDSMKEARHKAMFDDLADKLFGDFTPVAARCVDDQFELSFTRTLRLSAAANDDSVDWSEEGPVSLCN